MSFVRTATISLLCSVASVLSSAAQQPGPFLSLADLLRGAPRLANRHTVVRCHYAQGKQGPIVYDDDHKVVFPVLWSDQIRNTAQYLELITATETDWLVLTGELDRERNFVIYDGQFDNTPHVTIKIFNAKTNKPITDEKLNVALHKDQIGSVAMPTDKNGLIDVTIGTATIIRILSNMYADCRPRGELYTNYSIAQIHESGITTGNLCSNAKPQSRPGELILFEIPRTFIPSYPKPPLPPVPPVPVTSNPFITH